MRALILFAALALAGCAMCDADPTVCQGTPPSATPPLCVDRAKVFTPCGLTSARAGGLACYQCAHPPEEGNHLVLAPGDVSCLYEAGQDDDDAPQAFMLCAEFCTTGIDDLHGC